MSDLMDDLLARATARREAQLARQGEPAKAPAVDVAELLRLLEAATPGPWHPGCWWNDHGDVWAGTGPRTDADAAEADAALIAALRNAAPALLRRLTDLEAELEQERAAAVAHLRAAAADRRTAVGGYGGDSKRTLDRWAAQARALDHHADAIARGDHRR